MNHRTLVIAAVGMLGLGLLVGRALVDDSALLDARSRSLAASQSSGASSELAQPACRHDGGAIEREAVAAQAPEPSAHELGRWVPGLDLLAGKLSPAEAATANRYVEPMLAQALENLRTLPVDVQDPTFLANEARTVRRVELWKAVSQSLHEGDYLLLQTTPSSWRNPPGKILQPLPTWRDGKSVTLLFVLDTAKYPSLRDAEVYQLDMHKFRLREAARRYNALASAERQRRYHDYRRLRTQSGSWAALPAEVRAAFPLENRVREGAFLMGTPF